MYTLTPGGLYPLTGCGVSCLSDNGIYLSRYMQGIFPTYIYYHMVVYNASIITNQHTKSGIRSDTGTNTANK